MVNYRTQRMVNLVNWVGKNDKKVSNNTVGYFMVDDDDDDNFKNCSG